MKKNILFFVAGMFTMFVIILLIGTITQHDEDEFPGLTIFEEDGACVSSTKQIEIFQTLAHNIALAHTKKKLASSLEVDDLLILILEDENSHFYDEQKITIPSGKCAKQVGIYQYHTKNGDIKTVPAVEIK